MLVPVELDVQRVWVWVVLFEAHVFNRYRQLLDVGHIFRVDGVRVVDELRLAHAGLESVPIRTPKEGEGEKRSLSV